MPTTRAPNFLQTRSSFLASSGARSAGKSSSSHEDTTLMPRRAIGSICPKASLNLDTEVWKMTCGRALASSSSSDPQTRRPRKAFTPVRAPRSLPIFAGSISTPPTICAQGFKAASFSVSIPIGPRPNCAILIFIFKSALQSPRYGSSRGTFRHPGGRNTADE